MKVCIGWGLVHQDEDDRGRSMQMLEKREGKRSKNDTNRTPNVHQLPHLHWNRRSWCAQKEDNGGRSPISILKEYNHHRANRVSSFGDLKALFEFWYIQYFVSAVVLFQSDMSKINYLSFLWPDANFFLARHRFIKESCEHPVDSFLTNGMSISRLNSPFEVEATHC